MSEQSSNCSEDRLRSLLQSDDDFGDDVSWPRNILPNANAVSRVWKNWRPSLTRGAKHERACFPATITMRVGEPR